MLSNIARQWWSPAQLGFIEGRRAWDAVTLFEAAALHLARHDGDVGLLFIDFKAAFPSVYHDWIRLILRQAGLSEAFAAASMRLYLQCRAYIRYGGRSNLVIAMSPGIRQRCTIFALCIDPIIRMIVKSLPVPQSIVVDFADDLAIAMKRFLEMTGPVVVLL